MKFTVYWLGGDKSKLTGKTIADAMNNAGYGAGAVGAIDFYANNHDDDYVWDTDKRTWDKVAGQSA